MNIRTIEVERVSPPAEGKKQGIVKARDGSSYGVWPDKLGLLRPGHSYEVTLKEREWNGRTYYTIETCKPHMEGAPEAKSNGAPSAKPGDAEVRFVTRILAARIQTCAVGGNEDDIAREAAMIRRVYRRTFG